MPSWSKAMCMHLYVQSNLRVRFSTMHLRDINSNKFKERQARTKQKQFCKWQQNSTKQGPTQKKRFHNVISTHKQCVCVCLSLSFRLLCLSESSLTSGNDNLQLRTCSLLAWVLQSVSSPKGFLNFPDLRYTPPESVFFRRADFCSHQVEGCLFGNVLQGSSPASSYLCLLRLLLA